MAAGNRLPKLCCRNQLEVGVQVGGVAGSLMLGCRCELTFSLAHQHRRAAFERASDLEDDCQRGHVRATLDFSHV